MTATCIRRRRCGWMPGAVLALIALPATSVAAQTTAPEGPTVVFRLQDRTLTESSGLAVSRIHKGIVWTHNDGGSAAQVLALGTEGQTRASVTLRGVDPFDPEALAPGRDGRGRPALFLGDIGDNQAVRPEVSVFRFREPARIASQTVPATWFRFRYPDGAHDAEALLVHPRDGRVYIATKGLLRGGLYRGPKRLSTENPNLLERVGEVPGLITDGAFLPDGRFVLRSYASAYLYELPNRLLAESSLPAQEQGESLAVDGRRLLVGSEGVGTEVYAVPVPQVPSVSASPSPRTPSSPAPAHPSDTSSLPGGRLPVVAAAVVILLGALTLTARLRRRRRPGR